MKIIQNQSFDQERALYGEQDILLKSCAFDGPADGESALKECSGVQVENCFFNLRYPLWHGHGLIIKNSQMTELCRAALWYSDGIEIKSSQLHGIKALRECSEIKITDSDIISPEFGWSSNDISMSDCTAQGEYFMLRASHLRLNNVRLKGNYSFQYIEDALFENCVFDTKDAFWHAKNIKIRNSIIKGEYLAWYCQNVTFENCTITGTQPLCYCKGLKLINCRMEGADFAFERSDVQASITTPMLSIKNPLSGCITVPEVKQIIRDIPQAKGEIIVSKSGKNTSGCSCARTFSNL